jgi:hypothetical protein
MSAITVLHGSAGAHVHSGSAPLLGLDEMEDAAPGADAIIVAPGDEIYVDTDAGFLTCAPPPCAVVCGQLASAHTARAWFGLPCPPTEATAHSWSATGCLLPCVEW